MMKKIGFIFIALLLITPLAFGWSSRRSIGNWQNSWKAPWSNSNAQDIYDALPNKEKITFFKDFEHLATGQHEAKDLNADYAQGSETAIFTSTRTSSATQSPGTYIDNNGTIRLCTATANTARIRGGYYDTTGFHAQKGLMIESASTNLITKSNNVEDAIWTKTNVTADNDDTGSTSPDGISTSPSLTSTDANGTFLLASGVTAQTYSVWIKRKTGTGKIYLTADGGSNYTEITVTSSWARFTETRASASQTCGIKIETSGDAIYVFGNQFEASPYATSFIPTTTAALIRGSETLKYAIRGNRTAETESIFIKFSPQGVFANDSIYRIILDSDTKKRRLLKYDSSDKVSFEPNQTDSPSSRASITTVLAPGTSYVIYGVAKHTSPYVDVGLNGTQENTDTDDFTDPLWGTYFYVGSSGTETLQLNGILQSVAFYSDAKGATDVSIITDILNE